MGKVRDLNAYRRERWRRQRSEAIRKRALRVIRGGGAGPSWWPLAVLFAGLGLLSLLLAAL
ncbi:MAG: hypothetical protein QJR14_00820 [Bacillota bacterium]|nr:hypothetical protein [Bacillota bacterium]